MNTPDHAFWTFALFHRKPWWTKAALASVLPDLPFTLSSIYYFAAYGLSMGVWDRAFESDWAKPFAAAAHSIPVFVVALSAVFLADRRGLLPYFYGWGLHLAVDVATHVSDAQPVLWPLSDARFSSVVSYWENAYYGGEFTAINLALQTVFALYLLTRKGGPAHQTWQGVLFGLFALYIIAGLFLMFRHGQMSVWAFGLCLISASSFLAVALKSLSSRRRI